MNIIAIWDRQRVAPKSCLILILTADNQYLEISPDVKYIGKDKDNNSLFEDTGDYDIGDAFSEDIEFDFNKANYFALHFGFNLIKQFKESENNGKVPNIYSLSADYLKVNHKKEDLCK